MGHPTSDFFGPGSNFNVRFVRTYERLAELIASVRAINPLLRIVLIMGSWDILHVGHARYIEAGSKYGDVVIIGVDSDSKVRKRKGPNRPVVPEAERLEQLCHLRYVNLVVLKEEDDPRWHLIKTVRPDFLITIEENYTDEEREALKEFCGEVVVLPRQAETSTTAKLRQFLLDFGEQTAAAFDEMAKQFMKRLNNIMGRHDSEAGEDNATK